MFIIYVHRFCLYCVHQLGSSICSNSGISFGQRFSHHSGLENGGELFSTPEEAKFRCASFWRGLGGQFPLRKLMLPINYVSRNCILKFNMKNVTNGPLVGAPELPMGKFCVNRAPNPMEPLPGPKAALKNNLKKI